MYRRHFKLEINMIRKRSTSLHMIIKIPNLENKERILKALRENTSSHTKANT
jgi:hypothetical protein